MSQSPSSSSPGASPRLLIIDGHSMAYRAFFALPVENFGTSTGQPTNAVYGFTSMMANLLRDEQPTHVAVAFDVGRTTFRTTRYPEYKATRSETPAEFRGQIDLIRQVLDAMRIPVLTKPDFEADDILATLSTQAAEAGMDVLVCSGDRDSFQLVTERVTVLYPVRGVSELSRMTPEAVNTRYGVSPERYPDLAALVGESSDNLPGVPGVGPKTAAKWIKAHGDLPGVLAAAPGITGKVGESLRAHLDQVALNRELNRLITDLDLPLGPGDLAVQPWDRKELHTVLDHLQFRTLRDRLFQMMPEASVPVAVLALDLDTPAPGALGSWLSARAGLLGIDVNGEGRPGMGSAWGITVADDAGHAVVVDISQLVPEDRAALTQWLASPAPKAVHAGKRVTHALNGEGIALSGVVFDTELAAYLCAPDRRAYELADLAIAYLHRELGTQPAESGQGALDFDLDGMGEDRRAGLRGQAVMDLVTVLSDELKDRGAGQLLTSLELPLQGVLTQMERTGIAVDAEYLSDLDTSFDEQVRAAAQAANAVIGREVNLGSPKQLQEVLFDELQMPKTKKIKTGYTTDAAALADLFVRTEHPFLAHLLAHRDAIRLRQTVEGLRRSVQPDGRIHTTFQQTVAATGRLSSADPNLQNIPIRTEEGRRIRRAFVVGAQYSTLLTADYSQIEMRIMAHLSGDEGLIEAFRLGEDLHNYVASRVFGVTNGDVTSSMRSQVKAMSYGLAYGLSPYGLSQQLGVDVSHATQLRDDYFERFGGVRDYLNGVVADARTTGYTETLLGRRRYIPDLTSDNRIRREAAERVALNAPIQGSAADLIKVSMLRVQSEFDRQNLASRMLLQVHDELVVEVAAGEVDQVESIVREQMRLAGQDLPNGPLSIPLDVSVGTGRNWHEAAH